MDNDGRNGRDVDELLKQVLRDDLPREAESRMRERLTRFRRTVGTSDYEHEAGSAGTWRRPLRFEPWRIQFRILRKPVLAYASAIMLVAGAVIHLGGYQSVLADSIALLRTAVTLSEQMRSCRAMKCVIEISAEDKPATTYSILWEHPGQTRVDVESDRAAAETIWINQGSLATDGRSAGLFKPPVRLEPGRRALLEPVLSFLSPADLARSLDDSWQLQRGGKQKGHDPDRLVFIDRQDRAVIEVFFDPKSLLPFSLSRKAPAANGTGGVMLTARFTWNQPAAPELMVPGRQFGR